MIKIKKILGYPGYHLEIEVKSLEDQKSLENTLNYMVAKKNKSLHAKKGKIIPLAKMLKKVI